jgi:peptidoglycan/xylan/chitin deacetylase (PgdA/CDA1 family)
MVVLEYTTASRKVCQVLVPSSNFVNRFPGVVALTFDDGPSDYSSDLLDLLAEYDAKATFFITGNNNGKGEIDNTSLIWPSIIQRQYDDGHQIASHTWSHPDLSQITPAQRRNEMIKNEMALRNILGFIPTYMRPPYSSCTPESGCESDMAALGYHIIYFDLDTQDYLNDSPDLIQNSKDIVDTFFAHHTASHFDALAICHEIDYQTVYNLTEYLLQTIEAKGYTTVTVGECLGDPAENWYRAAS